MAQEVDITGFHYSELISITLLAKNPDGTPLSNAGSTAVFMTIGESDGGDPLLEFSTSEGSISVTDAGTAEFTITLLPSSLTTLSEGRGYHYNIWTGTGDAKLLQAKGRFRLLNSVEPS